MCICFCLQKLKTNLKKLFHYAHIESDAYKYRNENVQLHGCCLIFSKEYINQFDGLNDKTFMYMEEDLLFMRISEYNLVSIYNPDITVLHNEQSSTKNAFKSKKRYRRYRYKESLKSSKICMDELKRLNI